MNDARKTKQRHKVELLLGLACLVVVAGSGLWFLTVREGGRHVDGPERRAVASFEPEAVDLDAAREVATAPAQPREERRVSVPREVTVDAGEAPGPWPVGTGSISGSFSAPASVPADARVQVHAVARTEVGDQKAFFGPVQLEFGIGEPWKLDGLGLGTYRVQAKVEHAARTWTSSILEIPLAEGIESTGHQLVLVEYGVEGLVLDGNGIGVRGVHVELVWSQPSEQLAFQDEHEWAFSKGWIDASNVSISYSFEGDEEVLFLNQLLANEDTDSASFEPGGRLIVNWDANESEPPLPGSPHAPNPSIDPQVSFEQLSSTLRVYSNMGSDWAIDVGEVLIPTTDHTGHYSIPLPGPGRYGLSVNGIEIEVLAEDGEIEVSELDPVRIYDFEVVRAATLSGTVSIYSGESPAGVSCFLKLSDTRSLDVDDQGNFEFGGLWPGKYHFYARGGGKQGRDYSYHCLLEIEEGGSHRIDPILEPSFEIQGRLDGPPGEVANLRVVAVGKTNSSLKREGRVEIDGSFRIPGLYTSEYVLVVPGRDLTEEVVFFVDAANPSAFVEAELVPKDGDAQ